MKKPETQPETSPKETRKLGRGQSEASRKNLLRGNAAMLAAKCAKTEIEGVQDRVEMAIEQAGSPLAKQVYDEMTHVFEKPASKDRTAAQSAFRSWHERDGIDFLKACVDLEISLRRAEIGTSADDDDWEERSKPQRSSKRRGRHRRPWELDD